MGSFFWVKSPKLFFTFFGDEFLIQRPHKVHILKNKIEYISRDKLLKISLLYIEISINL